MISKETIEEIRKKTDIVKIISEYVSLKKRGKNYLALCPFHSEKTASFTVSPDKGIYHCFGCHEGGNVFSFIMKIENVSFTEAAEILANKLNITVKRTGAKGQVTGIKERYYEVMATAAKFYSEKLMAKDGEEAREYLTGRAIHPRMVSAFHLGYAGEEWDELFKFLLNRGYKPEEIEKTGLIVPRQGGAGYYDRFRGRIMFPIFDLRGRAIAFSGRILEKGQGKGQGKGPKYLNSPDTPIFNKGFVLYGLNLARESIKKHKAVVLVEGNLDLISCYQAGITQVVAPLGTGFTPAQARLLKRFAGSVIFAFDADQAGVEAMERCIPGLKEADLEISVAVLEGGKDPDEVIRKAGAKKLVETLRSAEPWMRFKLERILSRYNLTRIESKGKAAREAALLIAAETDQIVRKEYTKEVAGKIGVGVEDLAAEIRRQQTHKGKISSLARVVEKPCSKIFEAEKNLLLLALKNKEILETLRDLIIPEELNYPLFKRAFKLLFALNQKDLAGLAHEILEQLEEENEKQTLSKILVEGLPEANEALLVKDCLKVLKEQKLKTRLQGLKDQLNAAEKAVKPEVVKKLSGAISKCSRELHGLRAL